MSSFPRQPANRRQFNLGKKDAFPSDDLTTIPFTLSLICHDCTAAVILEKLSRHRQKR